MAGLLRSLLNLVNWARITVETEEGMAARQSREPARYTLPDPDLDALERLPSFLRTDEERRQLAEREKANRLIIDAQRIEAQARELELETARISQEQHFGISPNDGGPWSEVKAATARKSDAEASLREAQNRRRQALLGVGTEGALATDSSQNTEQMRNNLADAGWQRLRERNR